MNGLLPFVTSKDIVSSFDTKNEKLGVKCADFLTCQNLLPFTLLTAVTPKGRSYLNLAHFTTLGGHLSKHYQLLITDVKTPTLEEYCPSIDFERSDDRYRFAHHEAYFGRLLFALGANDVVPRYLNIAVRMANSIPKNVILADATALLLRERLRENLGAIYIGKMRKNNAKIVSDVYGALINTVSGVYCRRELFCHKAPNNPRNYMTISDDQIAALRDSGIESRVVIRR